LAVISYHDPHMDMETIISAVATTLGNTGPGFGNVGPALSFADIHPAGKIAALRLHVDRKAGGRDRPGAAGA